MKTYQDPGQTAYVASFLVSAEKASQWNRAKRRRCALDFVATTASVEEAVGIQADWQTVWTEVYKIAQHKLALAGYDPTRGDSWHWEWNDDYTGFHVSFKRGEFTQEAEA